jgi:uncharacterized LabA/DUF88 family protein
MEKAAIFIDAGYYYAQGSYAAFGETLRRQYLTCDEAAFLRNVGDVVARLLPDESEVLRTYWYDGARNGSATPSHLAIGSQQRVKLRLGRINGAGQQKGVDTLIVRDLMVLSQERSITHAFVLSGDEDLREGVAYAQDRGVVVGLLGIRGKNGTSQSAELLREADLISESATEAAKNSLTRTVVAAANADRIDFGPAADQFTLHWAQSISDAERLDALSKKPRIPKDVDWQLLTAGSRGQASGRALTEDEKRSMRRRFWATLEGLGDTEKQTPS